MKPRTRVTSIAGDQILAFIERRVREKNGHSLPVVVLIADDEGVDILGNGDIDQCSALIEGAHLARQHPMNGPVMGES